MWIGKKWGKEAGEEEGDIVGIYINLKKAEKEMKELPTHILNLIISTS